MWLALFRAGQDVAWVTDVASAQVTRLFETYSAFTPTATPSSYDVEIQYEVGRVDVCPLDRVNDWMASHLFRQLSTYDRRERFGFTLSNPYVRPILQPGEYIGFIAGGMENTSAILQLQSDEPLIVMKVTQSNSYGPHLVAYELRGESLSISDASATWRYTSSGP